MLQFVTDKLNLNSVRNQPHTSGKTYIQRAEFLEPFTMDMERADNLSLRIFQKSTTNPPPSEIIFEKITSTNEPQETIESQGTPESTKVTPRDYLQKFCLDSYGTPMEYNTIQNSKNGKRFWETVITHPESIMLYGKGTAPSKSASKAIAEQVAVNGLLRSLQLQPLDTPTTQSQENSVVIDADVTEIEQDDNDDFDATNKTAFDKNELTELIRQTSAKVIEEKFESLFRKTLDNFADLFDTRVKNMMDELMESKINNSVTTNIHKQLQHQTQNLVKNAVTGVTESYVTEKMKDRVVNSVAETISKRVDTHCKQVFERQFKKDVNTLVAQSTSTINTLKNKSVAQIQQEHTDSLQYVNQARIQLSNNGTKTLQDIDKKVQKSMSDLETETQGHLENIEEVAQSYATANTSSSPQVSNQQSVPLFPINEEVVYTDAATGQSTVAWIFDVIDDDPSAIYYYIRFANGQGLHTLADNLKRHTIDTTAQVKSSSRFSNVDPTLLQPKSNPNIPPQRPRHIHARCKEPDSLDLKSFHVHFKGKLRDDDDIINFYNQLRSQGKRYNIILIDIRDFTPNGDICPQDVPPHVRETMSLAVYQRMQDENISDLTYENLEHCLQQYAATSDGFSALKELLRQVHPELNEGEETLTIPYLSECNNNLYQLNKNMRTYFSQEEIKGRTYTAKEKAKRYLEHIDDDRYRDAVQQCLIDLNIATMMSEHIIQKQSLTFDSLPTTISQKVKCKIVPIVRSMTTRKPNHQYNDRSNSRGAYKPPYEAIQCHGCGQWRHKLIVCKTILKVAQCLKFIHKNKAQTAALVKEYLRVNDRNTKRSTVRLLQASGTIDDDKSADEYLEHEVIEDDMNKLLGALNLIDVGIPSNTKIDEAHLAPNPQEAPIESTPDPNSTLKVQKLTDKAILPLKATDGSAGYDLFSAEDVVIEPGATQLIKTDIAVTCPPGTYGRIAPRSGLTVKRKLDIRSGVIDSDYTGHLLVVMHNIGTESQHLPQGSKIAPLILERIANVTIEETTQLEQTIRGNNGFGSSDVPQDTTPPTIPIPNIADPVEGQVIPCNPNEISPPTIHRMQKTQHTIDQVPRMYLLCDPFGPTLTMSCKVSGVHPLLGLQLEDTNMKGRLILRQCEKGTRSAKIRKWQYTLRYSNLIRIDDVPVSTKQEVMNIIEQSRQSDREELQLTFATEEKVHMHPEHGTPQLFFDQLNTIAAYLQEIKYNETFIDLEHDLPTVNYIKKKRKSNAQFTRTELKARDDWEDWQQSDFKQLDLYEMQEIFGPPLPRPSRANILNLLWAYSIKADLTKKSHCVCNGNPRRK